MTKIDNSDERDEGSPFAAADSPTFGRDLDLLGRIVTVNDVRKGEPWSLSAVMQTARLFGNVASVVLAPVPEVHGTLPTLVSEGVRRLAAATLREIDALDYAEVCMLALYFARNPIDGYGLTKPLPYVDGEGRHFRAFDFSRDTDTAVNAWRWNADEGWSHCVDPLDLSRDDDRQLVTGGHVTWRADRTLDRQPYFGRFVDHALGVITANPARPEVQA
jgi:hypothetical protein